MRQTINLINFPSSVCCHEFGDDGVVITNGNLSFKALIEVH